MNLLSATFLFTALQGLPLGLDAFSIAARSKFVVRTDVTHLQAKKGFSGSSGGFDGGAKSATTKGKTKNNQGGGFGAKKKASQNGDSAGNSFQEAAARNPAEAKRILDLYGGDVQQGTIRRMNEARAALAQSNPLLDKAMKLTEEQKQWERSTQGLSLLKQTEIPAPQWEIEKIRKKRLEELANVSVAHTVH
jgi:hypothetical protein